MCAAASSFPCLSLPFQGADCAAFFSADRVLTERCCDRTKEMINLSNLPSCHLFAAADCAAFFSLPTVC